MLDLCALNARSSGRESPSFSGRADCCSALRCLHSAPAMVLCCLSSLVVQNCVRKASQMFFPGAALKPRENLGRLKSFSLSKTHVS